MKPFFWRVNAPRLLFIEPKRSASSEPLIDDLTRKITAAYREAEPSEYHYGGVHTCVCGASSSSFDYFLPDRTMTNSLCVHYLAFHRRDIPRRELRRVSKLSYGQSVPFAEELHGGRSRDSRPGDFIGKARLESLEALRIDIRSVYWCADEASLGERRVYFHLLSIFCRIPVSAIHRFVTALQKADQEAEEWSRNAHTSEGFKAATIRPLAILLRDPDQKTREWAAWSIGTLADTTYSGTIVVCRDDNKTEEATYCSTGLEKHQAGRVAPALLDVVQNESEASVRNAAIEALGKLGPPAEMAVNTIFELMHNCGCNELDRVAVGALCQIGNWAPVAAPVLIDDLINSNVAVRRRAAQLLARLGKEGRQAIPALLDVFNDETADIYLKRDVRQAIRVIDPSVAERLRRSTTHLGATTQDIINKCRGVDGS
jgi:hypothetical protein